MATAGSPLPPVLARACVCSGTLTDRRRVAVTVVSDVDEGKEWLVQDDDDDDDWARDRIEGGPSMTAFTVWKFEDPQGADHASSLLRDAAHDGLVKIIDHAVVSWPVGAERPTIKHTHDDTRRGIAWGMFWGLLFGLLFAVPVIGAAAGAAGGVFVKMRDGLGITDEQLDRIRNEVTEGTSALFLVTEQADLDRLGDRMRGVFTRLVDTNLTEAERSVLMETFGEN